MTLRHQLFFLCLPILCLASIGNSSCKKDSIKEETTNNIVINVSSDDIYTTKCAAEIDIDIDGFEDLSSLQVIKETKYGKLPAKHDKSILTKSFTYEYVIKSTDPDLIMLNFTGFDKNGSKSKTVKVNVHNTDKPSNAKISLSNLQCLSRVTGNEDNGHNGLPTVKYVLGNRTDLKYNVGGTDLGIVWEIEPGRYGLFFGDTYGADFKPNFSAPGPNGGSWRSNVVLFSNDTELGNGLTITGAATDKKGYAKEICFGAKNTSGTGDWTSIPTAAIHANNAEYVHYMNIKTWTGWVTNYSSLYKSTDKGYNWARVSNVNFNGESNFGQVGYYNENGIIYMIGTNSGRDNNPHLARFDEKDIESPDKYEFWNGIGWVKGREDLAAPLFNDATGELSFSYMPALDKWVLLYFNGTRYEISMRYADRPEGPWSEPAQVASGWQWAQLYGSYIHPLSKEGSTLYFIMSMWLPYNTYLMSIDLKLNK